MPDPQPDTSRTSRRSKLLAGGLALVAVLLLAVLLVAKPFSSSKASETTASGGGDEYSLTFDGDEFAGERAKRTELTTKPVVERDSELKYASACASCAKKHRIAEMPAASTTREVAPGARSSAEVNKALKNSKLGTKIAKGNKVELDSTGQATAPIGAPDEVQNVVAAANAINNFPYIWGGGHGSFQARGYDCSGSVSYALKGANLIDKPMVSGRYEKYGDPGPGKWITIYANGGHMFMIVAGVRYDTSFRDGPYGSRWQTAKRPMSGFVVRHPPGL
jgi:cell wall-associated NlpC family hydrolase